MNGENSPELPPPYIRRVGAEIAQLALVGTGAFEAYELSQAGHEYLGYGAYLVSYVWSIQFRGRKYLEPNFLTPGVEAAIGKMDLPDQEYERLPATELNPRAAEIYELKPPSVMVPARIAHEVRVEKRRRREQELADRQKLMPRVGETAPILAPLMTREERIAARARQAQEERDQLAMQNYIDSQKRKPKHKRAS